MVTDRGINEDRTAGDGKTFPLPQFTPTIVKVHFDSANKIIIDKTIPILNTGSIYVTGLSNTTADDIA